MEEVKEAIKLNDVTNTTDPFVVFDPLFSKTVVTKAWSPQNKGEEDAKDTGTLSGKDDSTRIDGIEHPIIKINKIIVENTAILEFSLKSETTLPTLTLSIVKGNVAVAEKPGLVNKITVIIIPPADGTYRKISLDFYIEKYTETDGAIIYECSYFSPALRTRFTEPIKHNDTNIISTYHLFETLAKRIEYGFAVTNQCKEIDDSRARISFNQTVLEVLNEHIAFGGVDGSSIFTYWFDFYGNIVLCNLSWVLSKAVEINELSIKQLTGINMTDSTAAPDNVVKFTEEDTFRSITNQKVKETVKTNIIEKYETENNMIYPINFGTNNTYYRLNHVSNGGGNDIYEQYLKIEEGGPDGKNFESAYTFENKIYVGVEVAKGNNSCEILEQASRRGAFINKVFSKTLKVVMKTPHLGFQRGTLINVVIFEFEREAKATLMNNMDNIDPAADKELAFESQTDDVDAEIKEDILNNAEAGFPNLTVSGMYYIRGVEYKYTKEEGLKQILYLLRKSPEASYYNYSSFVKTTK